MRKSSVKEGSIVEIPRDDSLITLLNNESNSINESIALIDKISKKHNIDFNQVTELLKEKDRYCSVPLGIFRSKLGPLEALVRYLKDVLDCPFCHIARMTNRDETTIWTTYQNSLKKSKKIVVDLEMGDVDFGKFDVAREELAICVSVFSERRLSILESLCVYLKKEFKMRYSQIGMLLERNERTVWTVVNRAEKKLHGQ